MEGNQCDDVLLWELICSLHRIIVRHNNSLDFLLPQIDGLIAIYSNRCLSMLSTAPSDAATLQEEVTSDLRPVSMSDVSTWVLTKNLSPLLLSLLSLPSPRNYNTSFTHLARVWPDLNASQRLLCFAFSVKHLQSIQPAASFDSFHLEGLMSLATTFDPHGPQFSPMLRCLNIAMGLWFHRVWRSLQSLQIFSWRTSITALDELVRRDFASENCQPIRCVVMTRIAVQCFDWASKNNSEISNILPTDLSTLYAATKYVWNRLKNALLFLASAKDDHAMNILFALRSIVSIVNCIESDNDNCDISGEIDSACRLLLDSVLENNAATFRNKLSLLLTIPEFGHMSNTVDPALPYVSIIMLFKEIRRSNAIQSQSEGSEETSKLLGKLSVLVAALALMFRFKLLTDPEVSITILGELLSFWSGLDVSHPVMYTCYEEIQSMSRSCPESLLVALRLHLKTTVNLVLLPVLRNCEKKGIETLMKLLNLLQLSKQTFAQCFGPQMISTILISREVSLKPAIKRIRDHMSEECKATFETVTSMEDNALFLYDAVNCSECIDKSENELMCGGYHCFLQEVADAFGIKLCSEIKSSTIQKVLTIILPELSTSRKDSAMRALRVLAVLYGNKSMSLNPRHNMGKEIVADVVGSNFLFIMSSVIQRDWKEKSVTTQICFIRALESIISLLHQADVSKFIHKFLFFIDSAMSSPSSKVHLATSSLICRLVESLHSQALRDNLSVLMVTLYRFIDTDDNFMGDQRRDIFTGTGLSNALVDYTPAAPMNHNRSLFLSFLFETVSETQREESIREMMRADAITVIRDLFSSRINVIHGVWTDIPYIPNVPELQAIRDSHHQQIQGQTTMQRIQSLSSLLLHESAHVRLASLRQLHELIMRCKSDVYNSLSLRESSTGSIFSTDLVSLLLSSLLRLCAQESDDRVRNFCGVCLGELGAIDPARICVAISLPTAEDPPWNRRLSDFGMQCIRDHLVPSLKAVAGGSLASVQDRVGFAIQEILRWIAESIGEGESGPLPERLKSMLDSHGVFEVCEPFWQSRYFIKKEYESEELAYWADDNNFDRWISRWCRHFMKDLRGPYKPALQACRGAIRSRPSLGQYLLPHLIVNTLQYGDTAQQRTEIIAEILRVLRSREDDGEAQSVQAIFFLMDALENWVYVTQHLRAGDMTQEEIDSAQSFCDCVIPLVEGIPKVILGDAALRIKSYARAIRYLEQDVRENNSTVQRVDGSNHGLPLLSGTNLDKFGRIYSELECGDGVRGVRQLRGIAGISCSPWNRIAELEADGRWQEALQEYEFLKSSVSRGGTGSVIGASCKGLEIIYRGRLRCLIELGQLDGVLPQVQAIEDSYTDAQTIRNALFPIATEALWQLGRWNALDTTLAAVEKSGHQYSFDDTFQLHLGRLFSIIDKNDRKAFICEMKEARIDVVTEMSAACTESYQRAYPYLTKLHGNIALRITLSHTLHFL